MKMIYSKKAFLGICLIFSFILGSFWWAPARAERKTDGMRNSVGIQTPLPEASALPSETPPVMETPSATEKPLPETSAPAETLIPATPVPTASPAPLVLKNKNAVYRAGKQTGIGYGMIKKGKIYRISSYGSDTVKLLPSKKCVFKVIGGIRKKDITSKKVKVSRTGVVSCSDKARNKKQYAILQVTAKETGECIYVYIYFAPRIYAKTPGKQVVYQGKTTKLSYNYSAKKIQFVSSNKKVARVDKKGKVTARQKGTTVIEAKVRGSQKNLIKVKITVKEEPWLVNDRDLLYSYEDMTEDLRQIAKKYRGRAALKCLGTSEDGRNIWCLRIGNPSAGRKLLLDGGIHAREWLNPLLLMRKSEEILRQYPDYKNTMRNTCLYVVPMINPDGVTISQYGFDSIRSKKLRKICKKAKKPARTWKGNARGVNLNFNFPGGWNIKNKCEKPDGMTYPGEKAASEKETKAMMKFVNSISGLREALNYHSTGSILYWNYNVEGTPALYSRQKALAEKVNHFTGYRLMPKSISTDPNGGFGDWLIYNKKVPNVTVETGSVMSPLPHSQLGKIIRENSSLLSWFAGSR